MCAGTRPMALIPFGPFELDLTSQELRKQGHSLHLPRQSFQILRMLLGRPGELVTREEMRAALWPSDTFVDFEHGLNAAINRLRTVLSDDADTPRYIETLPRRGYRFIGPVSQTEPAPVQLTIKAAGENNNEGTAANKKRQKRWPLVIGAMALCSVFAAGYHWLRPLPPPRALAYRQLTHDHHLKGVTPCGWASLLVTDGPRVFFAEPNSSVVEVSSLGGDTRIVATPFACFRIFDISPDKTELLGSQTESAHSDQPLWALSTATGLAHRLGNLKVHGAAWSPDGRHIAYSVHGHIQSLSEVYIADKDGANARKIATLPRDQAYPIRWSPDGKILRMIAYENNIMPGTLWEVLADGSNLHSVEFFPGEHRSIRWINWTSDGKYFLFCATRTDSYGQDIWAVPERKSIVPWKAVKPIRLTSGAMSYWNESPRPDSKQIFSVGGRLRGELNRFDLKSGRLEPFLSGISAEHLDFSRDGRWVAYVTYPEGTLWRSRVDGSEQMQLTAFPLRAINPRWSPDGRRIVFTGWQGDEKWKLYVVAAEGGASELVFESEFHVGNPTWSPDGNSLVFDDRDPHRRRVFSLDLHDHHVSAIPGSDGLFSPRLSPDGRFIVALDAPGEDKLMLFEAEKQKWSQLLAVAHGTLGWPQWSADSKSVYVKYTDVRAPVVYRISIADRKCERVASVAVPDGLTGIFGNGWMTYGFDGTFYLLRDLSISEIYAIDVDLP